MVVVVVVVVVVGALAAVALVVVVLVLRVCPQNPLAFRWGLGVGHRLQPLGLYGLVGSGGGLGPGLTATGIKESQVPGSVWPAAVMVCGGWMMGRLEMGMLTRVWTVSCCVAASVVAVLAGGRGARDAVCAGSWPGFGLGFGSGRSHFCCRRAPGDFLGLCGVVVVMLLLLVVVVVLLRALLFFGFRFWFGVGFWVGVRLEVEEDLVSEVRGHRCLVGGGSRCAAGVPGLPVWGSGGLQQLGVRLRLWPWPWLCG